MGFHNTPFPEKIDYMFQGGPVFKTTVIKSASGIEQRLGQWSAPLRQWKAASGPKNSADMTTIYEFFIARMGRLFGFLWKDWNDYKAVNQALVNPGAGSIQLQVTYPDPLNPTVRLITKLRQTVSDTKPYTGFILIDTTASQTLVEGTDYTCDYTTGVVTLIGTGGVRSGHSLQWTGEFYVPARFVNDNMNFSRDSFTEFNWQELAISELRSGV